MIKITQRAAEQIRKSMEQTQAQGLSLRVAVRRDENGTLDYGLGFDEPKDGDTQVTSEGIGIIVSDASKDLLIGSVVDYVEINPGEHQFIVINPNDPAHRLPQDAN